MYSTSKWQEQGLLFQVLQAPKEFFHDPMYSCKGNWKIYHSWLLSGAASSSFTGVTTHCGF